MALSEAEHDRLKDLRDDRRRARARAERYRRLSDEYKVLQADAELTLAAVEKEIEQLNRRS